MAVYVDDVRHGFGRMVMCHLWADTLDELLSMADTIGVQRKWIQGHEALSFGKHKKASWVHFDIALSKKVLALSNGAILTDKYGPVEHASSLKLLDPCADVRTRAQKMLDIVASNRLKFGEIK